MTKQEHDKLKENIKTWTIRALIVGFISPIVGILLGALISASMLPKSLEAVELRITCVEEIVGQNTAVSAERYIELKDKMSDNHIEILNILREELR